MGKITKEHIEKSFELGKAFYKKEITLTEAKSILSGMGMNESSAIGYTYSYSNHIQGNLYTWTINVDATEYYLKRIYEESGKTGLQNALLSLSQHIDYYEEKSKSPIIKRKKIYQKYLKIVAPVKDPVVYPDEVDKTTAYKEGKVKQVLINNYERNPIARKKCINHYGLNCQVCNFNFKEKYGDLGQDFIHVHHVVDIATVGNEYSVDPVKDLIPVCPNCHAMLHKKKPAFLVEELREKIVGLKIKQ